VYYLNNHFTTQGGRWALIVAGCGGTGGYVAEGLARLLPNNVEIYLVDFDRVEERNLVRQNFRKEDIGKHKSAALAERLSHDFDRPIYYTTLRIQELGIPHGAIMVGCLDNGAGRAAIAEKAPNYYDWWIDAGNGLDYGQILIGNGKDAIFDAREETVRNLPLPSLQRPEILTQAPVVATPNCAEIPEQGPTINSIMAAYTVETVHRMIQGTCPYFQLLIDLKNATVIPTMAEPSILRKMYKGKCKTTIENKTK
jgi:hypothetical protein